MITQIRWSETDEFFLLIAANGLAETAIVDGARCLCAFTSTVALGRFFRARYGSAFDSRELNTLHFDSPMKLLAFLRSNEASLADQDVKNLVVDPSIHGQVTRVPIRNLLAAELRRE